MVDTQEAGVLDALELTSLRRGEVLELPPSEHAAGQAARRAFAAAARFLRPIRGARAGCGGQQVGESGARVGRVGEVVPPPRSPLCCLRAAACGPA